jgi:hypothetical protein
MSAQNLTATGVRIVHCPAHSEWAILTTLSQPTILILSCSLRISFSNFLTKIMYAFLMLQYFMYLMMLSVAQTIHNVIVSCCVVVGTFKLL